MADEQPLRFPPFAAVLKSREVEDPINLGLHRPLAYLFARLVWRTPVTPNAVTFLAILVGLGAGACWLEGSRMAMVWGGILLWTSAILDGADGILARAKRMQSQFGRALDGSADMIVAAATVLPGLWHMWRTGAEPRAPWLAIPVILLTTWHLNLYDYYKESYLRFTRPDGRGESENAAQIRARIEGFATNSTWWLHRFVLRAVFLPYLRFQEALVRVTNPFDLGRNPPPGHDAQQVELFRRHNRGPMRLWIAISLAPHSYLMAICGIIDRLDIYLWLRLVGMNLIFLAALLWQRRASRQTRQALCITSRHVGV